MHSDHLYYDGSPQPRRTGTVLVALLSLCLCVGLFAMVVRLDRKADAGDLALRADLDRMLIQVSRFSDEVKELRSELASRVVINGQQINGERSHRRKGFDWLEDQMTGTFSRLAGEANKAFGEVAKDVSKLRAADAAIEKKLAEVHHLKKKLESLEALWLKHRCPQPAPCPCPAPTARPMVPACPPVAPLSKVYTIPNPWSYERRCR